MKKLLSVLLAVIFAACSLSLVSAEPKATDPTREPGVGMNVSNFNTVDLDGNTVTGDILQNADLTFINYWATWCGPCRSEMPHIQAMHEYYSSTPEADVQFIGVISEGNGCTPVTAKEFLQNNGYTWVNLRADSVLRSVFNTSGYIPQTIIVGRDGVVRDHLIGGFTSQNELRNFIEMWHDAMTIHANETCTVTYVNGVTGETIDTAEVAYAAVIPTPGTAPDVEGYEFKEWVYSGNVYESGYEQVLYMAMGDVTVTATYKAIKHKVKFYDGVNGNLITIKQVEHGQAAVPPVHPEHEGYIFQGWDTDFSCVVEDLIVTGICTPADEPTPEPTPDPTPDPTPEPTPEPPVGMPGDMDGDGVLSIADALQIARVALELLDGDISIADFNNDGVVTMADALLVMRAALQLG